MRISPAINALIGFASLYALAPAQVQGLATPIERRHDDPNGPIAGWTLVGCFTDMGNPRTLSRASFVNTTSMTPALCTEFCADQGFGFAGLEFSEECWCDFVIQPSGMLANDTDCDMTCQGDDTLICGGPDRLSIFTDGAPGPQIVQTVDTWSFLGCFTDGANRTLLERFDITDGTTAEACTTTCADNDFGFAGLEFGQECWCGTAVQNGVEQDETECQSLVCAGNSAEFCGGSLAIAIYQNSAASD